MVAYTGIETISNLAEEARDYGHTIPRAMGGVVDRGARDLHVPARGRAVGDAGRRTARPSSADKYAGDPMLGVVENMELGALQEPAEIYVGVLAATILFIATNAGPDRRVAAELLDGPVPAAARPPAPAAPEVPHAVRRRSSCSAFVACLTILPGQAEFLGTVYAFGAMLSFTIAHLAVIALRINAARRRAAVDRAAATSASGGRSIPLFAVFGGVRHRHRVHRRVGARPLDADRSGRSGGCWSAVLLYVGLPAATRGCR